VRSLRASSSVPPRAPVLVTEQLLVNGRILTGLPTINDVSPPQFGLSAAVAGFSRDQRRHCRPRRGAGPRALGGAADAVSAMATDSPRAFSPFAAGATGRGR